jgi:hypothetical protein
VLLVVLCVGLIEIHACFSDPRGLVWGVYARPAGLPMCAGVFVYVLVMCCR